MTTPRKFDHLAIQTDVDGSAFYLVINSLRCGTSSGGLRIAEDIDHEEVSTLAREMTLKFSFIGLPRGGAKSGLRIPSGTDASGKKSILQEVGRRLGAIIRAGIYYPGMDMNCGPDDLRAFYQGAGIKLGRITDTSFFTALSVANALIAVRAHLGIERPLTVAIEGFGSVGAYLAGRLPADQFRITTLSTMRGAIRNENGFACRQLVELRQQYGDDLIDHLSDSRWVELAAVLAAEVDILVPAARTFSISATNMAGIRARAVVPVANAPCTEDAFRTLHGRGVLCLPGFVTNSGGVFASGLHDSGVSTAEIERIGVEFYRPVVAALLQRAGREGVSPVSLAERIALQRFERNSGSNEPGGYGEKLLRKLRQRGVVPRPLEGRRTAARFVDNLRQLFVEVQGY
jgi:glutamate dehydrogenase/leucine dehydrogenase